MKISKAIEQIKQYYHGTWNGKRIEEATTRDQVLFGDCDQECTGIVVTCWANVEVIQKAIALGYNFIIVHEALFWNHGDHQAWLEQGKNQTYLSKKELLEEHHIVVWRNHDYIHSGIPSGNGYIDGIFYGFLNKLGWENYMIHENNPMSLNIPKTTLGELSHEIVEKLDLNGVKIIGSMDNTIERVEIAMHLFGKDNGYIQQVQEEQIDCFLTMETVDFTLNEYLFDSNQLQLPKSEILIGHFNLEEPGMEYMLTYLQEIVGDIPCTFVKAGDMYQFVGRSTK